MMLGENVTVCNSVEPYGVFSFLLSCPSKPNPNPLRLSGMRGWIVHKGTVMLDVYYPTIEEFEEDCINCGENAVLLLDRGIYVKLDCGGIIAADYL